MRLKKKIEERRREEERRRVDDEWFVVVKNGQNGINECHVMSCDGQSQLAATLL